MRSGSRYGPMVGIAPRRSAPASWSCPPRAMCWILPTSSSTRRACSTIGLAAAVTSTSFLLRSKSFTPELVLELGERERERGLGDEALLRRAAEMALLGEGDDVLELGEGHGSIGPGYRKYNHNQLAYSIADPYSIGTIPIEPTARKPPCFRTRRQARPPGHLPHPRRTASGRTSPPTSSSRADRRRVLAARRLHADLLEHPPAALQRARPDVLEARRGRDRVHLGQRRFRHDEWKKDQDAANITFIPDGNGEFTQKMGMLVDKSEPGLRQALVALLDAGARTA